MAVDPNEQWASTLRPAQPVRTRLARMLGVHRDERWRKGANGEKLAGSWLGRLPDGWHVFDDIRVGEGGANIDHLVIGPGGVFSVNTKSLAGKVWVGPKSILHNGHRTDLLRKATAEGGRVSRLLSAAVGRQVEVRSVLAILVDGWTIVEEPADVFVRGPRSAKNLILKQPVTLSSREVSDLVASAQKPSTWLERTRPIAP